MLSSSLIVTQWKELHKTGNLSRFHDRGKDRSGGTACFMLYWLKRTKQVRYRSWWRSDIIILRFSWCRSITNYNYGFTINDFFRSLSSRFHGPITELGRLTRIAFLYWAWLYNYITCDLWPVLRHAPEAASVCRCAYRSISRSVNYSNRLVLVGFVHCRTSASRDHCAWNNIRNRSIIIYENSRGLQVMKIFALYPVV